MSPTSRRKAPPTSAPAAVKYHERPDLPSRGRNSDDDPNQLPPLAASPDPVACKLGRLAAEYDRIGQRRAEAVWKALHPPQVPPNEYVEHMLNAGTEVGVHKLQTVLAGYVTKENADAPAVRLWLAAARYDWDEVERIVRHECEADRYDLMHAAVQNIGGELYRAWGEQNPPADPLEQASAELGMSKAELTALLADGNRRRVALDGFLQQVEHDQRVRGPILWGSETPLALLPNATEVAPPGPSNLVTPPPSTKTRRSPALIRLLDYLDAHTPKDGCGPMTLAKLCHKHVVGDEVRFGPKVLDLMEAAGIQRPPIKNHVNWKRIDQQLRSYRDDKDESSGSAPRQP